MNFPILENEYLQKKCDYSFGDQSGVLGCVPNAFMRKANINNIEFLAKYEEVKKTKKFMSLFIDNIRLYGRPIEYSDWLHMRPVSPPDRAWLNTMLDEDLLDLCSKLTDMNFIIFTAFEDTPLDEYIWDKIPENVLAIHAANSVVFGGKINPFPHGLERKMHSEYNHHDIMQRFILDERIPQKLLYVNCREDTGDRRSLYNLFSKNKWATVAARTDYESYLNGIKDHKFVLCPSGNGIESARNWETLYMKRIPIFKRHKCLEFIFKDFPAIFVDDFEDINEELLLSNLHLLEKSLNIDFDKLNIDKIFEERTEILYNDLCKK